jgi:hypothetical protein
MNDDDETLIELVVSRKEARMALAALERRWSELESLGAPDEKSAETWAACVTLREQIAFNEERGVR